MSERHYWIAIAPEDLVQRARENGYAELSRGQPGILKHLRAGDGLVFYCPRRSHPRGQAVQAFVALGRVSHGLLYQAQREDGSRAFRLAMDYSPSVPATIKPLLDTLSFIRSREHWGVALRHGARRVSAADFGVIARAMQCAIEREFAADDPRPPAAEMAT